MKKGKFRKTIDKEFKKITKNNKFLSPQDCTQLKETRTYLFELNRIIHHFEKKFNYIPSSAQLLFDEYNTKQEKMLFEKYKKDFLKE